MQHSYVDFSQALAVAFSSLTLVQILSDALISTLQAAQLAPLAPPARFALMMQYAQWRLSSHVALERRLLRVPQTWLSVSACQVLVARHALLALLGRTAAAATSTPASPVDQARRGPHWRLTSTSATACLGEFGEGLLSQYTCI